MKSWKRKKYEEALQLWFAQGLVASLHVFFRFGAHFGPEKRRSKLREFNAKMDAMDHERKSMLQKVAQNPRDAFEMSEDFVSRHFGEAAQPQFDEARENIRAIRQEGDELQAIRAQAADDHQAAVVGYRQYIEAHPNSRLAYSYLGGTLKKMQEWDACLNACREAERLSADEPISLSMSRLSIGCVLLEKGDLEAALTQFRCILEATPPEHDIAIIAAYLYTGDALDRQGKRREARSAWKQAAKRGRSNALAAEARKRLKANP